jgi:dihydroorotase-like cyclic amidohydrolase
MRLRGRVVATVLGGEVVFADDGVVEGRGRMLERR